jgi:hypothetical protein
MQAIIIGPVIAQLTEHSRKPKWVTECVK